MDSHFCTHTWKEIVAASTVQRDNHRDTLSHLCEIAIGIVCSWQQGELASGRLNDLLNRASVGRSAVSIYVDINLLAPLHIVDSVLINVCSDSRVGEISNLNKRKAWCYRLSLYSRGLNDSSCY